MIYFKQGNWKQELVHDAIMVVTILLLAWLIAA